MDVSTVGEGKVTDHAGFGVYKRYVVLHVWDSGSRKTGRRSTVVAVSIRRPKSISIRGGRCVYKAGASSTEKPQ